MADERLYGEVSGYPEGSDFPDRAALQRSGVHRPLQAGISGGQDGADSIVVSGGYVDDDDRGDEIIYTGQGGRDSATGRQIADQELTRGNLGLVRSQEDGRPVRVIRGSSGDPRYSPANGYRYDGLFRVIDHWQEVGKDGFKVWRFKLTKINALNVADTSTPAERESVAEPAPRWVVPAFSGEVTQGRDLLGVWPDANALAVLLASTTLAPPLAIGLFGEWGSGKTFFMRTLESEISALADSGDREFGRQVRSVWFNAWHYADANLWASLVHQIFLSLQGEQADTSRRLLDEALANVQGVQDARAEAEAAVTEAKRAKETAGTHLATVNEQHQKATAEAAKVTKQDIWAAIKVDERLTEDLTSAANALGMPAIGTSAREISHAAGEVRAAAERGRNLATAGPLWRSPLVIGLGVGLFVSIASLVLGSVPDWSQTWLAPMVAVIGQLAAIGSGAAGWLTRQAGLARKLLEPAERVQRQVNERRATLEADHRADQLRAQGHLAETEAKLLAAQHQLATAKAAEAAAKAELDQLSGPRLLERYLSERIGSGDYSRYLGLVALAHRDLQDLDKHLRAMTGKHKVDRIVLYVDDLDRCAPEVVVRVLEAVHLLLALPLFVVVVGVDVQWLVQSLRKRHPQHETPASPADYLDKIFQVTYQLPVMTPERCTALLQHFAAETKQAPVLQVREDQETSTGQVKVTEERQEPTRVQVPSVDRASEAAALQLGDTELKALQEVSPLFVGSPRRAKRFLNVYRICKARSLTDDTLRDQDPVGLLVLTALVVGMPTLIPPACDHDMPEDLTLGEWLPTVPTTFLFTGSALADVRMRQLMQWLPVVRRFAWPVVTS